MTKANSEVLKTQHEGLYVKLTGEEVAERGTQLARTLGDLEDLEKLEAEFKADLKGRREPLLSKVKLLGNAVRHGQELRSVKVDLVADFKRGDVDAIRQDTGEVIRTRKLTDEEKQGRIFQLENGAAQATGTEDAKKTIGRKKKGDGGAEGEVSP